MTAAKAAGAVVAGTYRQDGGFDSAPKLSYNGSTPFPALAGKRSH